MKKKRKIPHKSPTGLQINWLPLDSRILPAIIGFGHVRGIARIFLVAELVTSTLVVVGTLVLTALHLLS